MGMRQDLIRPIIPVRPMVGDVEALEATPDGADQDRDQDILMTLRQRLRDRQGSMYDTRSPVRRLPAGEEDKYEPQRLSRKICWQYDSSAKKVPLLRRHYI
jgi:hypothetical protein